MKRRHIKNELFLLERQHSVKVITSVESGSRQWGFHAADSDYDVRFIFRRHEDHALTIFPRKDTIESMRTVYGETLDMVGWDLKKALLLMLSGNVQPHEWLSYAPIHQGEEVALLNYISDRTWNPAQAIKHYLGIAYGNWKKYISGKDSPKTKRYLYVIRGLVNSQWVYQYETIPPNDVGEALSQVECGSEVRKDANDLLDQKRANELVEGRRIVSIDAMIKPVSEHEVYLTLSLE